MDPRGVCKRVLKPLMHGKVLQGNAVAANRTREIRPSGMRRGAPGNVAHGGTVNPRRITERAAWKPSA